MQLIEDYINQVGSSPCADAERVSAYAEALLNVAKAEGTLRDVEDELFRFSRLLEGNDELRNTLTDASIPVARRQQIVEDLLGGKASPTTVSLLSMVIGAGRSRDLPAIIDELVRLSAASADKQVAEVRAAVELTEDQRARLGERAAGGDRQAGRGQGDRRPRRARR